MTAPWTVPVRPVLELVAANAGCLTADVIRLGAARVPPLFGAHVIAALYRAESEGYVLRAPGHRWYLTITGGALLAKPAPTRQESAPHE